MKIWNSLLWIGMLFAAQGFCEPITDMEEFLGAKRQSDVDKQRDEPGCYMECSFDPLFDKHFHTIMGSCLKSLENPTVQSFETILALNEKGMVDKSWLDLETNVSSCAMTAIVEVKFPEPPFAPYHARITVNLEE